MIDPRIVESYEKHAADLMAYSTVVAGPQDAEDVVAEAMFRVFKSANWDKVIEPRGYLFRCVFNEAMRRGRRSSLGRAKEQLTQPNQTRPGPSGLDELGVFVVLSTRERAVIYLTYWEDASVDQVAHTLKISNGAVRRYLARAREKLREELKNE